MTGNRRYIRFPLYSYQIWTVESSYQPIRGLFLALFSYPLLGKVLSSYGREPRRNVLFAQNCGQIFRRSVEVRTFVRIQKVIWDHLLASKREAPFSFAWGTLRGEWLSPCYVVCSVFFCHACVTSLRTSAWEATVERNLSQILLLVVLFDFAEILTWWSWSIKEQILLLLMCGYPGHRGFPWFFSAWELRESHEAVNTSRDSSSPLRKKKKKRKKNVWDQGNMW